ncbi:inorganic phosphate transporter [Desulfohalobiaceae bacterium Ax17]|uniref:inorganic phosphate transporter n=1 Tax=Desulfovulcanus ferrireducens TaxID=2831190 RepID=UPI00207BCFB9|nr:inorganic phosphate transporter [Desulfovulcanus ferrireducens]MBT8762974.1 inorganic phosphate transporter [Desulfovulcanus ferrireducens]
MDLYDLFFYLSLGAGFLMAFNLGANDVANSMASAVGARAITVRQAVFIAGILNFVGAVFLGSHVTATISKGIINAQYITDPKIIMIGMFAALLSAALWVLVATLTALPVSSTHSIVGGILGFGLVAGGPSVVNWLKMGGIVLSWIISPFFAATIAYLIFTHIRRTIFFRREFIKQAQKWGPIWMGLTIFLIALSFLYKTPIGKKLHLPWSISLLIALALATFVWALGNYFVKKIVTDKLEGAEGVELIFRRLQVGTSCYVALSQGANDVANAIGPVAAIYLISKQHMLLAKAEIPTYILVLGGLGIAVGITVLGHKVMATVGEKITTLTNTRGFAVDFGAASTVLAASNLGLPVSTTHAAVGAVVGVGLARGFSAVDFKVLGRIVVYWVLTVPIAALTSIIIFQILKWIIY